MRKVLQIIPFCERQFDPLFFNFTKEDFDVKVNELFVDDSQLVDGYAPFCKHIFIENFTNAIVGSIPITDDALPLIRTAYTSRTENELAVLERWIPKESIQLTKAKYLDIILYSREQVKLESEDMNEEFTLKEGVEWGIVSIKPQNQNYETPMQPITIFRNSLGKKEGGSGVELNREKYNESVNFWNNNIIVK